MANEPTPVARLSEAAADLGRALESLGVPYAVIGGVAVSLVARPRYTADLDAVVGDVLERLPELVEGLARLGYSARVSDPVAFARANLVLRLGSPTGVPVDLSIGLTGFERTALSRARSVRLATGKEVRVCRPVDLAVMKALAGRAKDADDLGEVLIRCSERERQEALVITQTLGELLESSDPVERLRRALDSVHDANA